MIRCITNNALTYLLPFVTSKYNAITLRSEKGRVVETYSYSLENFELKDNTLIWRLISMKHKKLVKVGCKRKLFSERKNSSWKIWKKDSCYDYVAEICHGINTNYLKSIKKVCTALKSRPIRALLGFSKRRFGTAPTILGVQVERSALENNNGTLSLVEKKMHFLIILKRQVWQMQYQRKL